MHRIRLVQTGRQSTNPKCHQSHRPTPPSSTGKRCKHIFKKPNLPCNGGYCLPILAFDFLNLLEKILQALIDFMSWHKKYTTNFSIKKCFVD